MVNDSLGNKLEVGQLVQLRYDHGDLGYGRITAVEQGDCGAIRGAAKPAKITIQFAEIFILGPPDGNIPLLTVVKDPKASAVAAPG